MGTGKGQHVPAVNAHCLVLTRMVDIKVQPQTLAASSRTAGVLNAASKLALVAHIHVRLSMHTGSSIDSSSRTHRSSNVRAQSSTCAPGHGLQHQEASHHITCLGLHTQQVVASARLHSSALTRSSVQSRPCTQVHTTWHVVWPAKLTWSAWQQLAMLPAAQVRHVLKHTPTGMSCAHEHAHLRCMKYQIRYQVTACSQTHTSLRTSSMASSCTRGPYPWKPCAQLLPAPDCMVRKPRGAYDHHPPFSAAVARAVLTTCAL